MVLALRIIQDDESARKDFLVGNNVSSPIQGVAAVVDGAAALGLLMNGAEKLPLGGAHLGAGVCAAGRRVEEEADDEGVALRDEEAAELVEPDCAVNTVGGLGELERGAAR